MMIRCTSLALLIALGACASSPNQNSSPTPQAVAAMPIAQHQYVQQPATASLWNQEPQSLFGNRRARNVGDILTVIVSVNENASIANSLSRSRNNQEDFTVSNLFGVPEWANGVLPGGATLNPGVNVTRGTAADGDGSITRQERITLRLAAQVVEKLPNGHLVVVGTQRIRVNNETRDLKLHGVVRPDDITRDNTISHDKVAAADIVYSGHGQVAQSTAPKKGSRILDILIPF